MSASDRLANSAREMPASGSVAVETHPSWSVVVLARNASHLLTDCLRSVPAGVSILVIDDRSCDDTAQRARAAGARVVPGRGPLGALRQQGLTLSSTHWVLFLDADERLRPEAGGQIERALAAAAPAVAGFRLGFHTWLGSHRLWTGGWGRTGHLRLVRVAAADCDPRARVHERLEVSGIQRRLGVLVEHFSFQSEAHAARKLLRYAVTGARVRHQARVAAGGTGGRASGLATAWVRAGWRWVRRVVLLGAWLQPRSALRLANLDAQAVWLKHRRVARLDARAVQRRGTGGDRR